MTLLRGRWPGAAFLVALAVVALTRESWLPSVAEFLIQTDPVTAADVVVALAGDPSGGRVLAAVGFVQQGLAAKALLNGSGKFYDAKECEEAARFAYRRGARPDRVEPFCFEAESTVEEARIVDRELLRRGVRRALIVTSEYHTRRAATIFRRLGSEQIEYRFAASPTPGLSIDSWWRHREARAVIAVEYLKTVHSWLEDWF